MTTIREAGHRVSYVLTSAGSEEKAGMSREWLNLALALYSAARSRIRQRLADIASLQGDRIPAEARVVFYGAGEAAETGMAPSSASVPVDAGTGPAWTYARDDARTGSTFAEVPRLFLWLLDVLALVVAFYAAYLLAPIVKQAALSWPAASGIVALVSPEIGGEYRPLNDVIWVLFVMSAVTLLCLQAMGAYRPILQQSRTQVIVSTMISPLAGLSAIPLILFALRSPSWSRLFIFSFTALGAAGLCGDRLLLRSYRARRLASGFYGKNIVMIGSTRALEWISGYFERTTSRQQYQVLGYLDLGAQPVPSRLDRPLPSLGSVQDFGSLLAHKPIHEVVAIQGDATSEWLKPLIETCDYFRITLRIVPEALLFGNFRDLQFIYRSDPLKLPEVVLRPRDFGSDVLFVKRVIDIVVAGALLLMLLPLFALIALAIKLTTPGLPVFYRWRVVGYKGTPFTGYKFSTMVADADVRK